MRLRWRIVLPAVVVVAAAVGAVVWVQLRSVHQVSVSAAVDRYRAEQTAPATAGVAGPQTGVYVFATRGSERISVAGLAHQYPNRTTLTVTTTDCGFRLRWDVLRERWMQWQFCASPQGWRLQGYVDVHKFLAVEERYDYTCPGQPLVVPRAVERPVPVVCSASGARVVAAVTNVGHEQLTIGGVRVRVTHLTIVLHATGRSQNDGVDDLWLSDANGLPLRATVLNHGSQSVAGSVVHYDETAALQLTSMSPRR